MTSELEIAVLKWMIVQRDENATSGDRNHADSVLKDGVLRHRSTLERAAIKWYEDTNDEELFKAAVNFCLTP